MKVDVKEVDATKRLMAVKVDAEELSQIESGVLREIRKNSVIPGFRKGKVPVGIVKKRYVERIQAETLEKALATFYSLAIAQAQMQPISQGKITNVNFENMERGLAFDIDIEVEPKVELKKHKHLKVEREIPQVTEDMVNEALENIRENFATARSVEEITEGHWVTFDAQELGEGDVPVLGHKYEGLTIRVGSGEFDVDLENQLIGLKNGSQKVIRKTIPAPPDARDNTSRVESYKVTIHAIEERDRPPLDDEFVKNLQDEQIETLDQLSERLRDNIQADLERRSVRQFRERLIDELLKENAFDAPATMINNYLDHVVEDMKSRYSAENIDEELLRGKFRADAIHAIRWHLLKRRIIEVENVVVSDEEVFQRIDATSMSDRDKSAAKKDSHFIERLRDNLLEDKVVKLLEENADIIEIYPQGGSKEQEETPRKARKSSKRKTVESP